jgi:LPXTG-motif cell wall-anchored protein
MNTSATTVPALAHLLAPARAAVRWLLAALLSFGLLATLVSPVAADGYTGSDSIAVSDNSVQPGQNIVVFASGFEPGSTVTIVLKPAGTVLGTAVADSRGRVEVQVVVPQSTAVGSFSIGANGVNGQQPVELAIAIAVSVSGRPLPSTGGDVAGILVVAAACAAAGAFLVLRFRRRRAA